MADPTADAGGHGTANPPATPLAEEIKLYVARVMELARPAPGECWYVVPWTYLEAIATLEHTDLDSLAADVGTVDSHTVIDPQGLLVADTWAVLPEAYSKLTLCFGVSNPHSAPVTRYIVSVSDDKPPHNVKLEDRIPVFIVHKLSATTQKRGYYNREPKLVPFLLTKTFGALLDEIGGVSSASLRLWVIPTTGRIPTNILVPQFIRQYLPKLVLPSLYDQPLASQGIIPGQEYHVVVESLQQGHFPLDTYLTQILAPDAEHTLSHGGTLGLSNLGNTCYMNLALQCLLHIPELCLYFLFDLHYRELNKENPLGYHGDVAQAFGLLLQQTYDTGVSGSLAPREFKLTIGRYSQMFYGYMQQDSQELLLWLLDALHEDLNRIIEKPYLEKPELDDKDVGNREAIIELADKCWEQYKQRNSSVITDLFTGLYQLTLVCPSCDKTLITFDPFNDITLPLPIEKKWYHTFTVVDLGDGTLFKGDGELRMFEYEVELTKTLSVEELRKYVANQLSVDAKDLFIYDIFQNQVYKDYQSNSSETRFTPVLQQISLDDKVVIYYIPHDETDIIVPVQTLLESEDTSYKLLTPVAIPLFAKFTPEEADSFGTIISKMWELEQIFTSERLPHHDYYEERGDRRFTSEDFGGDGNDSDVSLADPLVNPDELFTINYHVTNTKMALADNRRIFVPYGGYLGLFSPLLAALPAAKRRFYYHKALANDEYVVVNTPEVPVLMSVGPLDDDESSLEPQLGGTLLDDDQDPPEPITGALPLEIGTLDEVNSDNKLDELASLESITPSTTPIAWEDAPRGPLITRYTQLQCEWRRGPWAEFMFDVPIPRMHNPLLELLKRAYLRQRQAKISLNDCLAQFLKPEVLGEHDLWYCPNCKEHKQATKLIQLWRCGDIVTIHLKRFSSARAFADKIEMVVDFPIEGLDLLPYIAGPGDEQVYDLIGVDNHYGGLGGGHYTACVKNNRDGKWYNYNDSQVSPLADPQLMITGAAYLLFYRKRRLLPLVGLEQFHQLVAEGRQQFEALVELARERMTSVASQIERYRVETGADLELDPELETSSGSGAEPEFVHELDDDLYALDDTLVRKQRLLEKGDTTKKVHITGLGHERVTHSPKLED